jgi:hypothetical protein
MESKGPLQFTRSHHWPLSWVIWNSVHTLVPYYLKYILILSGHLYIGQPSDVYSLKVLSLKFSRHFLPVCHSGIHVKLLHFIIVIIFGEQNKLSSSLNNFLYRSVTSSLLSIHIPLSTLFSNTFNVFSSFNVTDQVSHPYKQQVQL